MLRANCAKTGAVKPCRTMSWLRRMIAVGTPTRAGHGDADLSFVYMAARELAPHLEKGAVVTVKSTVPVGTGDVVVVP